ncbi:MAG: (Fe-S)-binding protein [Desulfobacterium sp.]
MNKKTHGLKALHQISEELDKCARCGECRSVCPIFHELGWEKYSARGKVALTRAVLNGELEPTDSYKAVINNCLLCLACVENCGSGVRMDHIITAARSELNQDRGLPPIKKIAHKLLSSGEQLMDTLAMGGSFAQYLLFQRLPRESGLKRRFPLPLLEKNRYLPALTHRSFRNKMPEINGVRNPDQTVLFFTGCLINYVYPSIGQSVVKVLNHFGTNVIIPRLQNCCGAPAEVGGDLLTTKQLAQKNIDALWAHPHDIVTACASGGHMLKNIYPSLFDKGELYYSRAISVASRTYDITEYLVKKIGLHRIRQTIKESPGQRVTYHDPCHLVRGQGIADEPRRLLRAAFANGYVEMEDANRCCGSGGTYGLTHRNTSLKILDKKTSNIVDSKADIVATACPGCMIQLKDGVMQKGSHIEVHHVMELIFQQLLKQKG